GWVENERSGGSPGGGGVVSAGGEKPDRQPAGGFRLGGRGGHSGRAPGTGTDPPPQARRGHGNHHLSPEQGHTIGEPCQDIVTGQRSSGPREQRTPSAGRCGA